MITRSRASYFSALDPSCPVKSEEPENVGEGTKKEQILAHRTALDEPDAPLTCSERHRPYSTALQRTVVPRSGRRGRRFKSCHPDQHHRRSQALTRIGEGLSCCQYRGKHRKYRNKSEHLTFSSKGLPQPAQRFAGTKRPQANILSPPTRVPAGHPRRKGLEGALEEAPPQYLQLKVTWV